MKKSIISVVLCFIMVLSICCVPVHAAGTVDDFIQTLQLLGVDEFGGEVQVKTDIKIDVDAGGYTEDYSAEATADISTSYAVKFKATMDMSAVRNKCLGYINGVTNSALGLDDDYINQVRVEGSFTVGVVFPAAVAAVIEATDADVVSDTGADMYGFSFTSGTATVTDVYTEYNPATGVKNREWDATTGELKITVYPKSPRSAYPTPGNVFIPLAMGDLRPGVTGTYAPGDYTDYLADLKLEFQAPVTVTHDALAVQTKGTAYGNVTGSTSFMIESTELFAHEFVAVQDTGVPADSLVTFLPEDDAHDVKKAKITATYEINDSNTKKVIFHINGMYLVPPAVSGNDYTSVVGPVVAPNEVQFDPSAYTTIPGKRTKYIFEGWSTTPDGANIVTVATTFTAPVTNLYAVFSERTTPGGPSATKITLHYIIDGKSDVIPHTTSYAPIKVDLTELQVPEKPGFKFDGWYDSGAYINKVSDIYVTSVSTSIYARYVKVTAPDALESGDHFAYIIGYPEGDVRPTNNITREEVATIFYRLLKDEVRDSLEVTTNNFSDVDSTRWSNLAISTMANGGYINGYEDGTFKPSNFITRAEFATIAARFIEEGLLDGINFTDISGHWAEEYIKLAAANGWVNGYEDGSFRPSAYIRRAEAITIINRVLVRYVNKAGLHPDTKQWPDNNEGDWYYFDMLEATNSHYYTRQSDGIHETWTSLKPNKIWKN